jgi:hypothetical protein
MRGIIVAPLVLAACALAACSRQDAAWADARREHSAAAFEAYLAKFPAGAHAAEARESLRWLQESATWARAERLRTPEAWQRYLSEWPEGRHAGDARSRLAEYVPRAPAGSPGRWSVQLGAFSAESGARAALARHARERSAELAGTPLVIQAPNGPASDVWRLRTSALPESAARDLCGRLRTAGVDCVPVVD